MQTIDKVYFNPKLALLAGLSLKDYIDFVSKENETHKEKTTILVI